MRHEAVSLVLRQQLLLIDHFVPYTYRKETLFSFLQKGVDQKIRKKKIEKKEPYLYRLR